NFGALSRGFGTCCLRFKTGVATTPTRLASGWLARLYREGVNPLDRYKRFQIAVPSSFSGFILAQGKFHFCTSLTVAVGTCVSSRAPRTEPYVRLSRIWLPPWVCDGEAIARPRMKDDRFREPGAAAWLMVRGRWRTVAGGATALLLMGWIGLYQVGVPVWVSWTPRAEQPDPPRADKAKATADAEAQRKAQEAEQQRLKETEQRQAQAAVDAEAKRQAAEAEQQRLAAVRAEEERKAKAGAEAEARAKAEQAEKERLAFAKAEEMRRKQAKSEAGARSSSLVNQALPDLVSGNYAGAIATLSEAIRPDPKNAQAFDIPGTAYASKGHNNRAIADFNETIRLDPNYAPAFCKRGKAKLQINDASPRLRLPASSRKRPRKWGSGAPTTASGPDRTSPRFHLSPDLGLLPA